MRRRAGSARNTGAEPHVDRRLLLGLGIVAGLGIVGPVGAHETDASAWVDTGHARVRLIDAGPDGQGRLAGLQIALDPGYLTYWRTPGEAGVPPTAVFDGSENLASATLAYPAPGRFDEGGADAYGYMDGVVFPVRVSPADPAVPVVLAVSLSFAVCSALCLPASASLRLALDGRGGTPEAALVREALRHVPEAEPLGAAGPLAVVSLTSDVAHHRAEVLVRAPAGAPAILFVEVPDPWYVAAGAGMAVGDGQTRFELRVLAGAKAPARIPIALTLVAGDHAIETSAQLDAAASAP